jgi:predicted nuclease of restriction endonuclease-like (RecB) superfamily
MKSYPLGSELVLPPEKSYPSGGEFKNVFSPQISWSHYRALMRVEKTEAREFYEREVIECGWDKRTLERQIHSYYYERMLKSQNPKKMLQSARQEVMQHEPVVESLKNPYVLEFLGLPDMTTLHETELESAIITHLQLFLLELGKGFAFVARQKRGTTMGRTSKYQSTICCRQKREVVHFFYSLSFSLWLFHRLIITTQIRAMQEKLGRHRVQEASLGSNRDCFKTFPSVVA